MTQRYKVWRIELIELEDDEVMDDPDCEVVVLESDYLQVVEDDRGVL
jgi:hypothetical protein